ncbi:MAG: HipA domain-containing protein [Verrucomicrobiota bacterium]|nr:HipA domain-containing protein [Verrucomicrobiota bacterium]
MRCFKCLKSLEKEQVHGLHKECFFEWFGTEVQFSLTMKTAGNSEDPFAHLNSSFFHGKFKKYSARLGGSGYLVKVRQEPYRDLPAMEFLCNQIARILKLPVPDFYLIKLEGHSEAFISKNFMEQYADANLVHLYRFMEEKSFNLKNVMEVISRQTGDLLGIEQFIRLCLFDMLIGNHDRHGRNLALVHTPKRKFLAPFYDNPSSLGMEEEWLLKAILEPCGKIHTTTSSEPKMQEYVTDFYQFGYSSVVSEFLLSIDLSVIKDKISNSFISNMRKQAFWNLVLRRYQELKKAVEMYELPHR